MPRLTKRVVESIVPTAQDVIAWDSDISGFGVRVRPSGRRTYFLKYRVGGGRGGTIRKPSIGTHGDLTCDEARNIAKLWKAEVAKGGDPGGNRQAKRDAKRITELCDRYLEEHAEQHKKPLSVVQDRRLIEKRIRPRLGNLKVEELTHDDAESFHRSLKRTPYEANRALALLSKAMNLAEKWGMRPLNSNPCRHVARFEETKRDRYLSLDEFKRLGETLVETEKEYARAQERARQGEALKSGKRGEKDPPAGEEPSVVAAIRLLIFTGCRLSEVLSLKWDYVNFEMARLQLPETKTGKKTVHLNAPALDVLADIKRVSGNPHVFPGKAEGSHLVNLNKAWRRVRRKAELEDLRLHDLRHSFASIGVGSGLSLPIIGALLGHTTPQTTARYAHLAADPLKHAVESVGSTISAAMRGDTAEVFNISAKKDRRHA